jgi:hypothetical protein
MRITTNFLSFIYLFVDLQNEKTIDQGQERSELKRGRAQSAIRCVAIRTRRSSSSCDGAKSCVTTARRTGAAMSPGEKLIMEEREKEKKQTEQEHRHLLMN